MISDPWQELEEIFADALGIEPAERSAFLERACENDSELRRRVDSLLAHSDSSGTFIRAAIEVAEAGLGVVDPPLSDLSPGTLVGNYRLERELGRGGMGEVWLANQTEPVKRQVALKLIKRGMDSRQVVTRFEVERQALALMDHPATARFFDAGTTADGRPFFAMEYIQGLPITHHCDQYKLTTRERLELFVQVCEGVNHAHQKGIIHRDLKPSNVLVAVHDQSAWPKIIDFGIAKAIDQRLSDGTLLTGHQWIGTPEYMSPEQAEMTRQDIDTRSDVYSLGVLLYELLVGVLPLDPEQLRDLGFDEIRRRIREDDPPTPSTRLSRLGNLALSAANRKTAPGALKRELRGDLDWITMKALEKDRGRRYGSASELAEDVRRYLADLPVSAGPPGARYRARKFVRRHRAAVIAATVVVVGLPLLIGLFAWQQRERAREEGRLRQVARQQLYVADMRLASQAFHEGRIDRLEELLDRHRAQPGEEDLRRFEWFHWWRAARLHLAKLSDPARPRWEGLVASPDGRLVAVSALGEVVLYDAESYRVVGTLAKSRGIDPFEATAIAFSPDGQLLAMDDGTAIQLWSRRSLTASGVGERSAASRLAHPSDDGREARVLRIAFSPTEPILATGDELGRLELWNHETGILLRTVEVGGRLQGLAFSSDGRSLLAGAQPGSNSDSLFVCDPRSGKILRAVSASGRGVGAFAYSPHSQVIATASREATIRLWDGRLQPFASIPTAGIPSALSFSADGRRLVAGTMGTNSVLVWELESEPVRIATLEGHSGQVSGVAFAGSGDTIWSASVDSSVRVWDLTLAQQFKTFRDPVLEGRDVLAWPLGVTPFSRQALAYSADGRRVIYAGQGGDLRSWSIEGDRWQPDPKDRAEYRSVAASNDGAVWAGITNDGQLRVWDIGGVEPRSEQPLLEAAELLAVTRAGTRVGLAVPGLEGVLIRDLITGRSLKIPTQSSSVRPQFSADGRLLLLLLDSSNEMWDASTDPPRRLWHESAGGEADGRRIALLGRDMSCAFSADGGGVAIGGTTDEIRLLDAETGQMERVLRGNTAWVRSLAFSPDGRSLVSGAYDGPVRIWDTYSGDQRSLLGSHIGSVEAIAFSPTGDSVASVSTDGELRIWLAATKQESDRFRADGENDRPAHR